MDRETGRLIGTVVLVLGSAYGVSRFLWPVLAGDTDAILPLLLCILGIMAPLFFDGPGSGKDTSGGGGSDSVKGGEESDGDGDGGSSGGGGDGGE